MGGVMLRNRIVIAPMLTSFERSGVNATEQAIGLHEERAKGGVGLVIVEATYVDSTTGEVSSYQLVIEDYSLIRGMNQVID